MSLRLDWCSHRAAKYAVLNWHYSKAMPASKLVRIGVWEDGRFVGVVIFGRSANRHVANPFRLRLVEVCELVRVALKGHNAPVSKIVAIALRMLKKQSPGVRVVVSYADMAQGHIGGIYQAGNWVYLGESRHTIIEINGNLTHKRTVNSRYGTEDLAWLRENVDPNAKRIACEVRHKYAIGFDKVAKRMLRKMAKPYPKRVRSDTSDTSADQVEKGGAAPTRALALAMGKKTPMI